MFSRIFTICIYALVGMTAIAAAEPIRRGGTPTTTTVTVTAPVPTSTTPASQCSNGGLQCCNSVQASDSGPVSLLLGLLGVVLQGISVPIGITCSPITVIGVGGTNCNQQAVCCENNNFNGIINIGCTPVNLGL